MITKDNIRFVTKKAKNAALAVASIAKHAAETGKLILRSTPEACQDVYTLAGNAGLGEAGKTGSSRNRVRVNGKWVRQTFFTCNYGLTV